MKLQMMDKLSVSLLAIVVLFSCTRNNFKDFVGPALCPSDNFGFNEPYNVMSSGTNPTEVDFASGEKLTISGVPNELVKWTVKIRGRDSKAVKVYSDNSKLININWYGESDSATFFKQELVDITLSIACKSDIVKTVNVTSKPVFQVPGKYILLSDFDQNGVVTTWYSYGGAISSKGVINNDTIASPQKGGFYQLIGDALSPTWYYGGFGNASLTNTLNSLPQSPDSVYCNLFIWSNGKTTSEAQINIVENSGSRLKRITVNWTGWKMVSFSLSSIGMLNTHEINSFDVVLGSAPVQSVKGELNVDFILFSAYSPFLKDHL